MNVVPVEPDLARDFKLVRESADRASMVAFFEGTGFEVTRQAAKSVSVRDPEFSKPFKLEGVLTHENWSTTRHAEIAAEYETGADANRTSRLDGLSHDRLRADLAGHVERRANYNAERYGALSVSQQELVRGTDRTDQELDDVLTSDHHGDHRDGDQLDDDRELALDSPTDALGADGTWLDADRQRGRDVVGAGTDQDAAENLHNGRQISDLHQDRGGLDDDTPDSLERDLLACVERLVTACEVSVKELSELEERSTNGMQSQMDGLAACV